MRTKLFNSFRFAISGIRSLIQSEFNARIHLLASVLVISAGSLTPLSGSDWALLIIAMGLVWISEAFNTAIESLADSLHPEIHEGIKRTKDIAAAAVLFATFVAVALGVIVFAPHYW